MPAIESIRAVSEQRAVLITPGFERRVRVVVCGQKILYYRGCIGCSQLWALAHPRRKPPKNVSLSSLLADIWPWRRGSELATRRAESDTKKEQMETQELTESWQ